MQITIVICAYNPLPDIFARVLQSCADQTYEKEKYNIIIVDNNSHPAISEQAYIKKFLQDHSNARCVTELQQGHTYARIRGINATDHPVIVFADDDNVLYGDYLEKTVGLFNKFPNVAVWGPGLIKVEFPEGAPLWVKKNFRALYQEKEKKFTQFGCVVGWPDYYPAGTGMAAKKMALDQYVNAFVSGKITSQGRTGNSLSCAEDSQIVWTAVKMGLCAGTSPDLKLAHVIPAKRTTREYLVRLNEGMASSYVAALVEMFPEMQSTFEQRNLMNKITFIIKTFIKAKGNPLIFYKFYTIERGWFKGIKTGLKK